MKNITGAMFEQEVMQAPGLVVLDFWAAWCGPCKMQAPVFEAVANSYPEVSFGKVNVDEEPDLAQRFGIMSIPTLVYLKNGEVLKKITGYQDRSTLEAYVEEMR